MRITITISVEKEPNDQIITIEKEEPVKADSTDSSKKTWEQYVSQLYSLGKITEGKLSTRNKLEDDIVQFGNQVLKLQPPLSNAKAVWERLNTEFNTNHKYSKRR